MANGINIPKKENNNTVLISFDAIIDIETGIYQCVYNDFKNKKNPYINYNLFNLIDNDKDLRGIRSNSLNNEDLLSLLFNGEAKESKDEIIKDYLEKEEERVYLKSQITDVLRLIKNYNKTDIVKTIICCENKCQENIIKKLVDNRVTVLTTDYSTINLDSITRIIIGDAKTLLKFKKFRMKNICILDFTNNFQLIEDTDHNEMKRILDPILIYYWDQNNIQVMNPYRF